MNLINETEFIISFKYVKENIYNYTFIVDIVTRNKK